MTEVQKDCFSIWWRELEHHTGERAALRRCSDALSVMMTPAYHRLVGRARECGYLSIERVAAAAGVLSHVRSNDGSASFPKLLSESLSEGRFRRIMTIDDPDELLVPLIRLVRFNNDAAPVESLGRDIQFWGPSVKQRWAFDYYENHKEISA